MRMIAMKQIRLYQNVLALLFFVPTLCIAQGGLKIGPGDVIAVHVYDTPEMEQTARVTESGDVHLALIGDVHVASLTPAEAGHEIERVLIARNVMKYPSVLVNVTNYETENVSVTGEVGRPGTFQLTSPRSVIDVISLSGGLTPLADRHLLIRRKNPSGEVVPYFFSNDPHEAVQNDVRVEPGDTVIVPRVGIVYVLGDVGRPGGFPMDTPNSRMTVLKAVALAGATNHTASPSKARLIRKTADGFQDIHVQISDIQKGKAPDVVLMPDDVLYIPFSYWKNAVVASSNIFSEATSAAIYAR
jgi:polysaccharide export outer membrane protein